MGFFKSLAQAAGHIVMTPVEVIKDVSTLGGTLTDQQETYTMKRLKKVEKKIDEVLED